MGTGPIQYNITYRTYYALCGYTTALSEAGIYSGPRRTSAVAGDARLRPRSLEQNSTHVFWISLCGCKIYCRNGERCEIDAS